MNKLIKRELLGEGHWLVKQGVPILVDKEEFSEGEYPGFTSPYKIDTETGLPELGDYFVLDNTYYVFEATISDVDWHGKNWVTYSEEDFNKKYAE